MAEGKPAGDSSVNWPIVGLGVIALLVVVFVVPSPMTRTLLAAVIMVLTVYVAQSREEAVVENPLFEHLHASHGEGLDRRKYGRLRTHTDRLLEHVRQMNRLAVEGREGKIAPRHAQAELDRLSEMMKDLVDEVRKTAGVPTPQGDPGKRQSQPQIVMPKPGEESQGAEREASSDQQSASEPRRPPPSS